MSGILKTVFFGLLALIGAAVAAGVIAAMTFDANDYKADIERVVEEETGRQLTIDGDLSLSFFPWLAVELPKLTFANREGFGDAPMFRVDRASLALKLTPIFRGALEVGEIQIDGAEVNLEIKPDGTNNWDDIVASLEEASAAEADSDDSDDGVDIDIDVDGDDQLKSFQVAGIQFTNTAVRYIDGPGEASFILEDFNFVTGEITNGADVALDGGFTFSTEPAALAGTVTFAGNVLSLGQDDQLSVADLNIKADLSGNDIGDLPVAVSAERIDYGTVAGTLAVADLKARFSEVVVNATLAGENLNDAPSVTGSIDIEDFSAKALLAKLDIPPPDMASPSALSRVGLGAKLAMTPGKIGLNDVVIRLDDTTFNGRLTINAGERNAYDFALAGDTLNIDDYLAPASEAEASESSASVDDTEIPVDLLKSMDARGSLKLASAQMSGMVFTNVDLGLNLAGGALRLNPLKADLFDGSYAGDIRIDASRSTPRLSLNETIAGVSLEPLARTMFETENLSGTIAGRFQLAGTGANLGAIRETLGGDIAFELADGALEGTDLWYQIRRAKALFEQEAAPPAPEQPRTPFSEVKATAKVAAGVLTNEDFSALLPFLQLTGAGAVDLVGSTVDYRMNARVLERPEFVDASAAELDEYTEAVIPIKITGALTEPSIQPDIGALAKARVQQEIDKKKDELKDKLLDRLGIDNTPAANDPDGSGETAAAEELDTEDLLKKKAEEKLFDLLNKKKK